MTKEQTDVGDTYTQPGGHQPGSAPSPGSPAVQPWSWTGGSGPNQSLHPLGDPNITASPTSGGGPISVDTDVIGRLVTAFTPLSDTLGQAASKLDGLSIAPGTFAEAATMANSVAGRSVGSAAASGSGLTALYAKNMRQMAKGVQDFVTALTQIQSKYTDVEDLNGKAAGDLDNALSAFSANIPKPPSS